MTTIRQFWSGRLPLDQAFWSYAVVGGIAVNLVTSLISLILLTLGLPWVALAVGYGLSLPYNFFATVGVLRVAARNSSEPQKAHLYSVITVIGMVILSLT